MAPQLLRQSRRANVSYREPSSDDDFSDSDSDNVSRRKRPTRRSTRHLSTEVEQEPPAVQPAQTARPAPDKRTLRRKGKRKVSYRDVSTDEESEDGEADYEPDEVVVAHKKQRIQADSRPSTSRRGLGNGSRKSKKPAMRALGAPLKEKKGMSIPVVCHCILINTQQHTNLSLCTFLPTGTNQTWRRCPITSSSKSSSTLLTRCITRTCKLPLLYPGS